MVIAQPMALTPKRNKIEISMMSCRNANCSTDGINTILVTTITRAIIS